MKQRLILVPFRLRAFFTLLIIFGLTNSRAQQNSWTQKANFGGAGRTNAAGFSISDKGYIGTGLALVGGIKKDFWEYNPTTDAWTQKADFGGTARFGAVGFSIGNKGFIGTGRDANSYFNDFWEYDTVNNTWSQKANFKGKARVNAVGFSIGKRGYIGTGCIYTARDLINDFFEYNPSNDSWRPIANFAGTGRQLAVGFSIGNKGYVGTGKDVYSLNNDFWEYDPSTNRWSQKADLAGEARLSAVGFAIGSKGYIGIGNDYSGSLNDFLEYDPATDTWRQQSNFAGAGKISTTGFSIGKKGYIGCGEADNLAIENDFWEYKADYSGASTITMNKEALLASTFNVFSNPANGTFTFHLSTGNNGENGDVKIEVFDPLGQAILLEKAQLDKGELQKEIQIGNPANGGIYLVKVKVNGREYQSRLVIQK